MWNTESLWFEVSIVSIIYALGNILMGQFEEQTPKIRRVGKYLLTTYPGLWNFRFPGQDRCDGFTFLFYFPVPVCSRILFTEEKRYKWLDRRTQKQVL